MFLFWLIGQNGLLSTKIENDLLNSEKIREVYKATKMITEVSNLKSIDCQSLYNIQKK